MRKRREKHGLTVNAIAGTHVVLLGFDLSGDKRKGCLGFAIQREDHEEEDRVWLRGMKTFEATAPAPDPGVMFTSNQHPFQSFQWADYSAHPGRDYTFKVVPLYGSPSKLEEGDAVSVDISTEKEGGATHSVFFNRGAVSSQEYARRFQNRAPDKVGEQAWEWLSRGLVEALLGYLERAEDASWSIYGAVYELKHPTVLLALRAASSRGAKVRVIYDCMGQGDANNKAIIKSEIEPLCVARSAGKLMHNKFFVLAKNDTPVAVWTGSTNITVNGIYGHSNCGHIVEDRSVAKQYLAYWQQLREDPDTAESKDWIVPNNIAPPSPWNRKTTVVFSPHRGDDVLEWYAAIAGAAKGALFMTFAFGMDALFKKVYDQNDGVLRYALMEKEGNGAALAQGKIDIRRIRKLPNVIVAVANSLRLNAFDRWLAERQKLTKEAHVKWIHTKYMVVDPLSKTPVVVTGSANFSKASTSTNDENMLVIRSDRRVADIYLTEFMRLHSHYAFREAVAIAEKNKDTQWQPKYLVPDDSWQKDHFKKNHPRCIRRSYFAG